MIEPILPAAVAAVDTREDRLDIELFPQEREALRRAVDKRRREFTTARACAREALAALDIPPCAIPSGEHGQPRWPAGIVGSITHCAGYRACALARTRDGFIGLGIDAEPNEPLRAGLLGRIARTEEPTLTALLQAAPGVRWDRLVFSAKESVYKLWFGIAQRSLDLQDTIVDFDVCARTFRARLLKPWPPTCGTLPATLEGRFAARDGLLLTAVVLPAIATD